MTRRPTESFELVVRALVLQRGRLGRDAVVASLDQARASLRREPTPAVARPLTWICDVVEAGVGGDGDPDDGSDDPAVESAFAAAARALEDAAGAGCWY